MIWPGWKLFARQSLTRTTYIRQELFRRVRWIVWNLSKDLTSFEIHRYSNNHWWVSPGWHPNFVWVVLETSMYFSGRGNGSSLGSLTWGSTWWRYMKLPNMDQKSFIASQASGNESWSGGRDPSDFPKKLILFSPWIGRCRTKVGLWSVCDLNPSPPPPPKNVSLSPPPPDKCLWHLTFPNVKNNPGGGGGPIKCQSEGGGPALTKMRAQQNVSLRGPGADKNEGGGGEDPPRPTKCQSEWWKRRRPKAGDAFQKTLTFYVFLCLPRCPSWHSGRSTTAPLRLTFCWGGSLPTPPHFCQRRAPPSDWHFFGGGGGRGSNHNPTCTQAGCSQILISSRGFECIEFFREDFRCVHRLQLLKVCDQHVTQTPPPAHRACPRNNPGESFFPNWWILEWSFTVIKGDTQPMNQME